eukprot:scaffold10469_cov118-Isochrysis_galbana.AAC.9
MADGCMCMLGATISWTKPPNIGTPHDPTIARPIAHEIWLLAGDWNRRTGRERGWTCAGARGGMARVRRLADVAPCI